jgi:hypothetical protein
MSAYSQNSVPGGPPPPLRDENATSGSRGPPPGRSRYTRRGLGPRRPAQRGTVWRHVPTHERLFTEQPPWRATVWSGQRRHRIHAEARGHLRDQRLAQRTTRLETYPSTLLRLALVPGRTYAQRMGPRRSDPGDVLGRGLRLTSLHVPSAGCTTTSTARLCRGQDDARASGWQPGSVSKGGASRVRHVRRRGRR